MNYNTTTIITRDDYKKRIERRVRVGNIITKKKKNLIHVYCLVVFEFKRNIYTQKQFNFDEDG